MKRRMSALALLSVLAIQIAPVHAQDFTGTPGNRDYEAARLALRKAKVDLFDSLRNDDSPRLQVLAGRVALDHDDAVALAAVRKEAIARAASLAPDDAFVQWQAVTQGSYASGACGPTHWPDFEVGNLLRLEPDNANAWEFALALADAKGDAAGMDEALSRMATAARADDHFTEQLAAWRDIYVAHPEFQSLAARLYMTEPASVLFTALKQVTYSNPPYVYLPSRRAFEAACTADGQSERAWRRLSWCRDAAFLLASEGTRLQLREEGVKVLSVLGDRSATELQRQLDWLEANGANPLRNRAALRDPETALDGDWQDARSEIDATERRLQRTGAPLTAPLDWMKAASAAR